MSRLLRYCTYDNLLMTLLAVVIVLACSLTPMQADTWWQLRAGRDIWQSGHVLLRDVYSHTAYGAFWPNHEWLAEVLFYGAYRLAGLAAVTLFAAALIVAGWAISWTLGGGSVRARFVWFLLAIVPASVAWEPRPHAFSLLLLPAVVYLLVHRMYLWLPITFAVWANCHGGVLLGLPVLAAGLAAQTWLTPARWWKHALLLTACALALCATPLGLSFWTEIPQSLSRINQYAISEWRRPLLTDVRMLPFWALSTVFVISMIVRGRRLHELSGADVTLCVCALPLLPMAAVGLRHVSPFLMIAVPALTRLVPFPGLAAMRRDERPVLHLAIMSCAVLGTAATLTWAYRHNIPRLQWSPVPAPALDALRGCPENLYNRYDEGGSLIWFLPEKRVFLDGRQDPYVPELVFEHVRVETAGGDPRPLFSRYGIRCAYLPTSSPTAVRLSGMGWTTLYRDRDWIVLSE